MRAGTTFTRAWESIRGWAVMSGKPRPVPVPGKRENAVVVPRCRILEADEDGGSLHAGVWIDSKDREGRGRISCRCANVFGVAK